MKINCELDAYEYEELLSILRDEIVEYRIVSKLEFLNKDISKSVLKWSQGHANFLEKIALKLSDGKFNKIESKVKVDLQ